MGSPRFKDRIRRRKKRQDELERLVESQRDNETIATLIATRAAARDSLRAAAAVKRECERAVAEATAALHRAVRKDLP